MTTTIYQCAHPIMSQVTGFFSNGYVPERKCLLCGCTYYAFDISMSRTVYRNPYPVLDEVCNG